MKLFSVFDHNSKFLTHIVAGSPDEAFDSYKANVCLSRFSLVSVFFVDDDSELHVALYSLEDE